jgi:hypothetical protein
VQIVIHRNIPAAVGTLLQTMNWTKTVAHNALFPSSGLGGFGVWNTCSNTLRMGSQTIKLRWSWNLLIFFTLFIYALQSMFLHFVFNPEFERFIGDQWRLIMSKLPGGYSGVSTFTSSVNCICGVWQARYISSEFFGRPFGRRSAYL